MTAPTTIDGDVMLTDELQSNPLFEALKLAVGMLSLHGHEDDAKKVATEARALLSASKPAASMDDERAAFERPPLPAFPESFAHIAGHAYFTEHQMQGYANAYGELVRAASPQPVAQPVEQTRAMTDDARAVITMLINLARTTYHALDNSEECTGDDGRFHAIGGPEFDEMSDALDALEELPDDRPGYTLAAPGKAEWALRALLTTARPASGADHD